MLNELIRHIEVHQAEKVDGVHVQRLSIRYHCVGTQTLRRIKKYSGGKNCPNRISQTLLGQSDFGAFALSVSWQNLSNQSVLNGQKQFLRKTIL